MGRQVCFFATNEDLQSLIELVKSKGGIFVNLRNEKLEEFVNGQFFITLKNSKLSYWNNNKTLPYTEGQFIDRFSSEIVILDSCRRVEFPNKDPYGYEHGRFWYETSYFDNDGNTVKKSKELDLFFNSLKRYITKNYILSINKHWYMGPDAYQKYLEGNYVPYSGITPIKFPK